MKIKPSSFVKINSLLNLYLGVKPKGKLIDSALCNQMSVIINSEVCCGEEVTSKPAPVETLLVWGDGNTVEVKMSDLFGYSYEEIASFVLASSVTEIEILHNGLRVKSPLFPNGEILFPHQT